MRVAGIMSGTSLDGVDVAVVDIGGRGWNKRIESVAFRTTSYPEKVRQALLGVSNTNTHTAEIAAWVPPPGCMPARRETAQAPLFESELSPATAGRSSTKGPCPVPAAFASTLQIGDASCSPSASAFPSSRLPPRDTGRRLGRASGPVRGYLLFRHRRLGRVALNIGGIANITRPPGSRGAYRHDTGPGNMIVDAWRVETRPSAV
jgi:anhydro-N-acetylmuramic acid kinase